ncbi:MAG: hypothetical protein Q9190_004384 [Brigantiaea leucoxantha]
MDLDKTPVTDSQIQGGEKTEQTHGTSQDQTRSSSKESEAARIVQRTYRGHRTRRELNGLTLSPSARWTEVCAHSNNLQPLSPLIKTDSFLVFVFQAIKEARYRNLTTPHSRTGTLNAADPNGYTSPPSSPSSPSPRKQWRRIGSIVHRATGSDEDLQPDDTLAPSSPTEHPARLQARAKTAQTMDLAYFLEMVDLHHRYGSNLRKYHQEWKRNPTRENFFYWLDHGEGKGVSLQNCPRERLEKMRVRYLGREERRHYEVMVGKDGRLCWRRNGVRVDTGKDWRDSVEGIVRLEDEAEEPGEERDFDAGSLISSGGSSFEGESPLGEEKKEQPDPDKTMESPGLKGWMHESRKKILAHRPFGREQKRPAEKTEEEKQREAEEKQQRKRLKNRKWIFVHSPFHVLTPIQHSITKPSSQVADTSHTLYIGIKQSGAFQHSSFLHGSRVSAAGIIEVHDGQLQFLQPRSGHYKPPASSFLAFIHSLQEKGVDMSLTSLPKSYAVLLGLETYGRGMNAVGKVKKKIGVGKKAEDEGGSEEEMEREKKREREREKERRRGWGWERQGKAQEKGGEEEPQLAEMYGGKGKDGGSGKTGLRSLGPGLGGWGAL